MERTATIFGGSKDMIPTTKPVKTVATVNWNTPMGLGLAPLGIRLQQSNKWPIWITYISIESHSNDYHATLNVCFSERNARCNFLPLMGGEHQSIRNFLRPMIGEKKLTQVDGVPHICYTFPANYSRIGEESRSLVLWLGEKFLLRDWDWLARMRITRERYINEAGFGWVPEAQSILITHGDIVRQTQ